MEIVLIKWLDPVTSGGGWTDKHKIPRHVVCHAVGFIEEKTKEDLKLSMIVSNYGEDDDVNNTATIPRKDIVYIKSLRSGNLP